VALFNFFAGKDPGEHEKMGDGFFTAQAWGKAKIEYDKALSKLEKQPPDHEFKNRIFEKIRQTKEALAFEHKQTAENLIEQEYFEDARQYYSLALELTQDPTLKTAIETRLAELEQPTGKTVGADIQYFDEVAEDAFVEENSEDYFMALCGRLPEDIQDAYLSYGEEFKTGYLALNRGDFGNAADYLLQAMENNQAPDSYIPLELATAYFNLENYTEAQSLLELFLERNPDALPGYQLLCTLYWEMQAFDRAEALLDTVPPEVAESMGVYLLRGETLFHSGRYVEVQTFYTDILDRYGWSESIAKVLAQAYEAQGELENARNMFSEIMSQCQGCGARIDPSVKHKYAELSYITGRHTTDVLELFLSLAQQIPEKAPEYYHCVSRIYEAQGNVEQAQRFRLISEKMESERTTIDSQ